MEDNEVRNYAWALIGQPLEDHNQIPALDIIVVNWNSDSQLRQCLDSINQADKSTFVLQRVVVVDNASTDESAEGLNYIDLPLVLIRNSKNRGFAAGCNQGAASSSADYALFLNPDIVLFGNSLKEAITYMGGKTNSTIGILGIQLVEANGFVIPTCSRFATLRGFFHHMLGFGRFFPARFSTHFMTEWDHAESRVVDQVMGAFFLVRRTLFEALRGFDDRFFVYFEDMDFAYRAKLLGWSSFYLADVKAFHKGCGTTERAKADRLAYSLHSRILYGRKHFGHVASVILAGSTLLVEPVARLLFYLQKGDRLAVKATLLGTARLWRRILGRKKRK